MSQAITDSNARTGAGVNAMHSIERQVLLRAPRSRVWNALTDVKKFCEWFGVDAADGEFKPGAKVRMSASESNGGDFDIMVEQMQPEHLFTWRWHPGARDPAVDYDKETPTLVEFKLADAPGGTTLTIRESGFDNISLARRARVFGENNQGWDDQIKNLERYVTQAS
jgi:uncharacterized protein YndB with AHSA1/START domain